MVFYGNVTGNVKGNVTGDVTGNIVGNVTGNVIGNVYGVVKGDISGNVTGNVVGKIISDPLPITKTFGGISILPSSQNTNTFNSDISCNNIFITKNCTINNISTNDNLFTGNVELLGNVLGNINGTITNNTINVKGTLKSNIIPSTINITGNLSMYNNRKIKTNNIICNTLPNNIRLTNTMDCSGIITTNTIRSNNTTITDLSSNMINSTGLSTFSNLSCNNINFTGPTINIGTSSSTINIIGSTNTIQSSELKIKDKLITLNKNGPTDSAFNSGFEIEENGNITGYIKTSTDRNSILIKPPLSTMGSIITYTIDPSSNNIASSIVMRDLSSNFSANIITSDLSGNATTCNKLKTSRLIAISGDCSGNILFDGSSDISLNVVVKDSTITTSKLSDGSITNDKIANNSITTSKIVDNSITLSKFSNGINTTDTITITDANNLNSTHYLLMVSDISGSSFANTHNNLNFNPSSNLLTVNNLTYTTIQQVSDIMMKDNIKNYNIINPINIIKNINLKEYNFISNKKKLLGYIAQDVEKGGFKKAIQSNNLYKKIIPNYFTLLHTEAIKELIKRNEYIKQQHLKIRSLEKRLYK